MERIRLNLMVVFIFSFVFPFWFCFFLSLNQLKLCFHLPKAEFALEPLFLKILFGKRLGLPTVLTLHCALGQLVSAQPEHPLKSSDLRQIGRSSFNRPIIGRNVSKN